MQHIYTPQFEGLFLDPETCEIVEKFEVSPGKPFKYGFLIYRPTTFDLTYAVTLVNQQEDKYFASPSCVFLITAKGPAVTDSKFVNFGNADCSYYSSNNISTNMEVSLY